MRRQLFYRICTLRLFIQNRIITALWERLAGKLIYPNERWSRRCKKGPDSNDLNDAQRRESWKKLIVKASQSLNMLIRRFINFTFPFCPDALLEPSTAICKAKIEKLEWLFSWRKATFYKSASSVWHKCDQPRTNFSDGKINFWMSLYPSPLTILGLLQQK